MNAHRRLLFCLVALSLPACSGTFEQPGDATVGDQSTLEGAIAPDQPSPVDAIEDAPDNPVDAGTLRDATTQDARPDAAMQDAGPLDASFGTDAGGYYNTYYYLAREADYTGADNVALYDSRCQQIATVPAAFSDSVCVEGSGQLTDGTVINYAASCSCGRPCPTGGTVCYSVLDRTRFPWGQGSRSNPLLPLRSWATDVSLLPTGTIVYVPRWDGVSIPMVDGLGGFVHDGCFRADDTGGAIRGAHYDFFAGTANMWRALERLIPTRTTATVYRDSPRCAYLLP